MTTSEDPPTEDLATEDPPTEESPAGDSRIAPTDRPDGGTDAAARRLHVLLVDDSPELVDAVAGLIERDNDDIRVTTATGAVTAFRELTTATVDCIVSDYRMPAVDGLEFLDAVRERDEEVSFILFTNKGSEAVADAAIEQGVTDYVPKGTDPDHELLVERIREAVGDSAARSS
ncbi:response regulator [Haloglomus halophilum]|uniref:response regulator n=1 Tax=Haloglomus halophilum TaxID=2962672 RepID=UPI0020C9E02E|nr:response regulator [Haloglomus halophilum]